MPFTVTLPKLSPTMEEGTIVKWHKSEGDHVEAGELLMEVASDKATVEHEALDAGYLRKILVADGDEARVNQPVAIFTEAADESIDGYEPEGLAPEPAAAPVAAVPAEGTEAAPAAPAPASPATGTMREPVFQPEAPLDSIDFGFERGTAARVAASPLARRMAEQQGLDISSVKGSGPRGRIMSRDLERAPRTGGMTRGRPELPSGTYEEEKMSPMRKTVGRRLQEAKSFIPHFYVTQTIDAEQMVAQREQLKAAGVKVTYNDFVLRACALALKEHPEINSGYNSVNQSIIRFKTVDISVAVTVDGGLITPIVRHTDHKSITEISAEVRSLAGRARDNALEPHEYKGGSFTVSNLGMFGVSDFTAVINPPQAAILAVSGIQEVPVIRDGQLVPGKIMRVTLSSDHRVIDGADAARFCQTLQKYLEAPAALLL